MYRQQLGHIRFVVQFLPTLVKFAQHGSWSTHRTDIRQLLMTLFLGKRLPRICHEYMQIVCLKLLCTVFGVKINGTLASLSSLHSLGGLFKQRRATDCRQAFYRLAFFNSLPNLLFLSDASTETELYLHYFGSSNTRVSGRDFRYSKQSSFKRYY